MTPDDLARWVPARAYPAADQELLVNWADLGGERFVDPFVEQTLAHAARKHPWEPRETTGSELAALVDARTAAGSPPLPLAGIVFHVSRCGSTLVTQMLAASARNVVLSEPPALDGVLAAKEPDEVKIAWLRAMVGALGQKRHPEEARVILKADFWHAFSMSVFRRAFPGVPALFLYREPLEVVVSQLRSRSRGIIPGPAPLHLYGIDPRDAIDMPDEELCARVIGATLREGLAGRDGDWPRLVAYEELPEAIPSLVERVFGLALDDEERARAADAARRDAKEPKKTFVPDGAAKRKEADAATREACARWAAPHYEALEAARRAQGPLSAGGDGR